MKKYFQEMWQDPSRMERLTNFLALLVGLVIILTLWHWLQSQYLVRTVVINSPLEHLTIKDVHDALTADEELQKPLLTLSLDEVRQHLQQLPWVRHVEVRRMWPDTLVVDIREHEAQARWGTDNHRLVSSDGTVYEVTHPWPAMATLPLFIGPRDDTALEILQRWREWNAIFTPLEQRVVWVELSPRLTWRLRLLGRHEVVMGRDLEQNLLSIRLQKLAMAWRKLPLGSEPWVFDLRYPNGFVMRPVTTNET